MEEKKKKTNYFKIIFIVLFIIFISLYFMNVIGYYDVARNRTALTQEQINRFERDIEEGNYIDLNDYLEEETKEYDNGFSNISLNISNGIDTVLNNGLKSALKAIEKLFK